MDKDTILLMILMASFSCFYLIKIIRHKQRVDRYNIALIRFNDNIYQARHRPVDQERADELKYRGKMVTCLVIEKGYSVIREYHIQELNAINNLYTALFSGDRT